MQVLKVTFGVLLFSICALFSLRFYGLGQKYQAYDHPLLKLPTPLVIAYGGDSDVAPSHSRKAFEAAQGMGGVFLAANVHMNAQKHFYVIPPEGTKEFNLNGKKIAEMSDSEVLNLKHSNGESPIELSDFLDQFKSIPILLILADNIENIDLRIEPILKKYNDRANIMVHSEYDNVCSSIKKLLPQFLYGTGVGQRVRALMLGSLWLEPAAKIDGDFLIAPLKEGRVKSISKELKNEVERRQKLFILGPLDDEQKVDEAVSFGASGYLTTKPNYLKNKLSAPSARVDL